MGRRAFVIVLDACGAGALPDAADYGDAGASTLQHVAEQVGGMDLPTFQQLGLGDVLTIEGVAPSPDRVLHGRMHPLGPGKDTTTGHWELMGLVAEHPMPSYPNGFPPEIVALVERIAGRDTICNRPYDGIKAITDYGVEHVDTGKLILYTSADSVLQIAAHEEAVLSRADLHALCKEIRGALPPEHDVGRVIARPFTGPKDAFKRTDGRKDFALRPEKPSYLDALQSHGIPVHSVGKVADVFAGRGFDHRHPGANNPVALESTAKTIDEVDEGLVFVNLVDTDQIFGHRKDTAGFHGALQGVDRELVRWLPKLDPANDLFILCADHGVDPLQAGSDHTREYAPLLARFAGHGGRRHDGPMADVGASVLKWLADAHDAELPGTPFL